jgi:hypothetical protein
MAYNIVRDWEKLQGYTDVSDEIIQIRRDLNSRHVSIENSGQRPVSIAIASYYDCPPTPNINFTLQAGEVKNIGVNTMDGPIQYIHMLDPVTKKHVGSPYPLHHNIQSFVLRDGLNKWFVQGFQTAGFKGH